MIASTVQFTTLTLEHRFAFRPGEVALAAETIQHFHSTLRSLPRPLLESLTRAFRKRFQVPEAAARAGPTTAAPEGLGDGGGLSVPCTSVR